MNIDTMADNNVISEEFDRVMTRAEQNEDGGSFETFDAPKAEPQAAASQQRAEVAPVRVTAAAPSNPAPAFDLDSLRNAINLGALPQETQQRIAEGAAQMPSPKPLGKLEVVKSLAGDILKTSKPSIVAAGVFVVLSLPQVGAFLSAALERFSIQPESLAMLAIKALLFLVVLIASLRLIK